MLDTRAVARSAYTTVLDLKWPKNCGKSYKKNKTNQRRLLAPFALSAAYSQCKVQVKSVVAFLAVMKMSSHHVAACHSAVHVRLIANQNKQLNKKSVRSFCFQMVMHRKRKSKGQS